MHECMRGFYSSSSSFVYAYKSARAQQQDECSFWRELARQGVPVNGLRTGLYLSRVGYTSGKRALVIVIFSQIPKGRGIVYVKLHLIFFSSVCRVWMAIDLGSTRFAVCFLHKFLRVAGPCVVYPCRLFSPSVSAVCGWWGPGGWRGGGGEGGGGGPVGPGGGELHVEPALMGLGPVVPEILALLSERKHSTSDSVKITNPDYV